MLLVAVDLREHLSDAQVRDGPNNASFLRLLHGAKQLVRNGGRKVHDDASFEEEVLQGLVGLLHAVETVALDEHGGHVLLTVDGRVEIRVQRQRAELRQGCRKRLLGAHRLDQLVGESLEVLHDFRIDELQLLGSGLADHVDQALHGRQAGLLGLEVVFVHQLPHGVELAHIAEHDVRPGPSGPAGPSRAVHEGLLLLGEVVVDDALDVRHVDAACRDVGGHEEAAAPVPEGLHRVVPRLLTQVPIQRSGSQRTEHRGPGDFVALSLGFGEDDRRRLLAIRELLILGSVRVVQVHVLGQNHGQRLRAVLLVDHDCDVPDGVRQSRRVLAHQIHDLGIAEEAGRGPLHPVWLGGRPHARPAVLFRG
eukprot:scaffold1557_cov246-Pinguiococcus_pyrenoidosus.AAC.1